MTVSSANGGDDDRVRAIFEHYDANSDGLLSYAELRRLQLETSGDDLDGPTYCRLCKSLKSDPKQGLTLEGLRTIYGNDGADVDADFQKMLSSLSKLLNCRKAELEKREEDQQKAEAAFAEETAKAYGSAKPGDVIRLNIGGTKCEVLRRTLCHAEGSMLASQFSGLWDDSLEKDKEGDFFIDQPYKLFIALVDFFRACAMATPKGPPISIRDMTIETGMASNMEFVRMVEYYGCTPAVYPTKISLYKGNANNVQISQFPGGRIEATEWSTFLLRPDESAHNRNIISFQIEICDAERVLVGVIESECAKKGGSDDSTKGVGEEGTSLALDCCNSSLLICRAGIESTQATKPSNVEKGTVIRFDISSATANPGWPEAISVNGEVVTKKDEYEDFINLHDSTTSDVLESQTVFPAFSVKGSVRVTEIDLGY